MGRVSPHIDVCCIKVHYYLQHYTFLVFRRSSQRTSDNPNATPFKWAFNLVGLALQIQIGPDHFAEVKHHARKGEMVAEFSGSLLVLAVGNSRQAGNTGPFASVRKYQITALAGTLL